MEWLSIGSNAARGNIINPMKAHNLDVVVSLPDFALAVAASPGLPIVTVPMGALGHGAKTI